MDEEQKPAETQQEEVQPQAEEAPQDAPGAQETKDPAEALDAGRAYRHGALQEVGQVLAHTQSRPDKKLSNKGAFRALAALQTYCVYLEGLVEALVSDLYRAAQSAAVTQSNIFGLSLTTQALLKELEKKNLVTTDEVRETLEKEVLPEQMKQYQKPAEGEKTDAPQE